MRKFLTKIPFSHLWIHAKAIGEAKTVLDLGCGDGYFMRSVSEDKGWSITGVDIFKSTLDNAKKTGIYNALVKGELLTVSRKLIEKKKKYDVVFCSEIIEHLDKKQGEVLLELVEKLAKRRIVVATPRGFMVAPHEFIGDNPHQVHLSGWEINDFKRRGYIVRGFGFYPVWSECGLGRSKNKLVVYIGILLNYFFSPIVYYFPRLSAGLICIKNL
jgi:SAM-dependent methyltransferase